MSGLKPQGGIASCLQAEQRDKQTDDTLHSLSACVVSTKRFT